MLLLMSLLGCTSIPRDVPSPRSDSFLWCTPTPEDVPLARLSTTEGVALYLTGIDEPPAHLVDDSSPYPSDWSAARWIAHLARSRGLPVWGENGGQDDVAKLQESAQRMHANGFLGLMWAFESELYADPNPNGYATIGDYQAIIAMYSNLDTVDPETDVKKTSKGS